MERTEAVKIIHDAIETIKLTEWGWDDEPLLVEAIENLERLGNAMEDGTLTPRTNEHLFTGAPAAENFDA